MEYMANLEVFLLRDNTEDIEVSVDGEVADLSGTTKIELKDSLGQWAINSEDEPNAMTVAKGNGLVTFSLGASDLPMGDFQAWLVLYDSANTSGVVLGPLHVVIRNI